MRYDNIEKLLGKLISSQTNVSWDVIFPKILPPLFFIVQLSFTQNINQLEYATVRVECVSKNNDLLVEFVRKIQKIIFKENSEKTIFRNIKIISTSREHSFDSVFGHKQIIDLQIIEK